MLNLAENKLLPQGDVRVLINDDEDKSPTIKPGGTLLSTLASENIFIPSACGGGGTCSQCKCQVLEGGGDILQTEIPHFSRKEIKENYRLACQVKVKEDMKIKIPDEIFSIKKWECTVRSNDNVATFIKELVLELPKGEILDFESGGYIQIDIRNMDNDTIANRIVVTIPMPRPIHESVLPVKLWPTAKAIKNGDHAAAVTIPRSAASAANRRSSELASDGKAADKIANAPVFITLPKILAAK